MGGDNYADAAITLMIMSFLVPNFTFSSSFFLLTLIVQTITIGIFKYLLYKIIKKGLVKSVLVVGPAEEAYELGKKIIRSRETHLRLKYLYLEENTKIKN